MKREFLEGLGLDKETVEKIMAENGADIERETARTAQAKADLTAVQEQLAQRDKDLEELKGKAEGAQAVQKQLDDLQAKYKAETDQYKAQLADRDYSDAVRAAIADKGVKFSSKAAEKAFISDLTANRLPVKDGKLDGFEAYHKAQMEADPDAFQSDKPTPKFVQPVGPGGSNIQTMTDGERAAEAIGKAAAQTAKTSSDIISMYTGGKT